ncbi:MAG: hypothetical protein HYS98_07915 [Deltaproteobacteria bacterium]|nr:hypothetical protein [Deltaproteobacteria bacterium]
MKEPITSLTDFALALEGFFFAYVVFTQGSLAHKESWGVFFVLLSLGAALGGLYHGFTWKHQHLLWFLVTAFLLFAMSFFPQALGSLHRNNITWPSLITKTLLMMALFILFLSAWLKSFQFPFCWVLIFEGCILLICFVLTFYIFASGNSLIALFLALGFCASIIAALFQTRLFGSSFWIFKHNDVFHIIQIVGLVFFFMSWKTSLSQRSLL